MGGLLTIRQMMNNLPAPDPVDYDLDSWAITITPHQLTSILSPMALVNLAHHQLLLKDPGFEEYTYVSSGGCTVRMRPIFKEGLLSAISELFNIITHISPNPTVLNKGSPSCTVGMLREAFLTVNVPTLRLASYGIKCPFRLVSYNLGQGLPPHLQLHPTKNHFDIGFTYYPYCNIGKSGQHILLAKRPPNLPKCDSESYPLLLELGKGYGSVNLKPDHEAITRLKCYSTLAHALKATSQKDMKYPPTTAVTWNTRLNTCENKGESLLNNNPGDLAGIRFEATVYAHTVEHAQQIVHNSGYLHPLAYDHTIDRSNIRIALQFKAIPVSDYFSYLAKMIRRLRRAQKSVPQKHDNRKSITKLQKQMMVDLQNALGWNSGRGQRPTPWDADDPWWNDCLLIFNFISTSDTQQTDYYYFTYSGLGEESEAEDVDPEDYFKRNPKDLWQLRPRRICPCPKCHAPGAPKIPKSNKRSVYPRGTLTSVGGKENVILRCNHCCHRISSQSDVVLFLATWIGSLGMKLLSEAKRRTINGGWSADNSAKIPSLSPPPHKSPPFPNTSPSATSPKGPSPSQNPSNSNVPLKKNSASNSTRPRDAFSSTVREDIGLTGTGRQRKTHSAQFNQDKKEGSPKINSVKADLQDFISSHTSNALVGWRGFAAFLLEKNLWNDCSAKIPSVSIPTSIEDSILEGWKLSENFINGDGNCLFRAVAIWLFGNQEEHRYIRDACVQEMQTNPNIYSPYVTQTDLMIKEVVEEEDIYSMFLMKSREDTFWGGDHHLAAIAEAYQLRLVVLCNNGQTYEHRSHTQEPKMTIFLWFNGINHYEIIWNPSIHSESIKSPLPSKKSQTPPPPLKSAIQTKISSKATPHQDNQILQQKRVSFAPVLKGEIIIPTETVLKHLDPRLHLAPLSFPEENHNNLPHSPTPDPPASSCPAENHPNQPHPPTKRSSNSIHDNQPHRSVISRITNKHMPVHTLPANTRNQFPQKKYPVVVIPPAPKRPQHANLSSLPQNQTQLSITKRKRKRISGFEKNHGLPIVTGYWLLVNERLLLETGKKAKTLPYVTICFGLPLGLLKGWCISHKFITSTAFNTTAPDETGFYHAVSYWINGNQESFKSFRRHLIKELSERIPSSTTTKVPITSPLTNQPFADLDLGRALKRVVDGKKPHLVEYIITATLLSVVLVVVEMGPTNATWKEHCPHLHKSQDQTPSLYLFYNSKLRNFEIIWNPFFHQPQTNPATSPSLDLTVQSPLLPHSTGFIPPRSSPEPPPPLPFKSKKKPEMEPSFMATHEDLQAINFAPVQGHLQYFHLSQNGICKPKCRAMKEALYFEIGNFKYIGWRLSLGYIVDDNNNLWRALSLWKYHKQEDYHRVKFCFASSSFTNLGHFVLDQPFNQESSSSILQRVSTWWNVRIVVLHIQPGHCTLQTFLPKSLTLESPSISGTYFLYRWKEKFGILYCKDHL